MSENATSCTLPRRVFRPGSSYVSHLLKIADRLDKEAGDDTQIGRDYRDHAQMQRAEVHQILCHTHGIGHTLCRKGTSNCPVYLEAVRLAAAVEKAASSEVPDA